MVTQWLPGGKTAGGGCQLCVLAAHRTSCGVAVSSAAGAQVFKRAQPEPLLSEPGCQAAVISTGAHHQRDAVCRQQQSTKAQHAVRTQQGSAPQASHQVAASRQRRGSGHPTTARQTGQQPKSMAAIMQHGKGALQTAHQQPLKCQQQLAPSPHNHTGPPHYTHRPVATPWKPPAAGLPSTAANRRTLSNGASKSRGSSSSAPL